MYHYYMFNKPVGCVTARTDDRYPTVMDYFKELHNENLKFGHDSKKYEKGAISHESENWKSQHETG